MSKPKNIKEIVAAWLKEHGYDGLVNLECGNECGCGIDDLMPVKECPNQQDCRAAYKHRDGLFYMIKEKIIILANEAEYTAAIKKIEEQWNPSNLEMMFLLTAVEEYEKKHYPVDPPTPEETAKFRKEQEEK